MAVRHNFLVIGAARSGTTAPYAYPKQYPKNFTPEGKEPNFFAIGAKRLGFQRRPPIG